jgi:hypothetical protein
MYYRDRFISMLCVDLNTYHLQFVQEEEKRGCRRAGGAMIEDNGKVNYTSLDKDDGQDILFSASRTFDRPAIGR